MINRLTILGLSLLLLLPASEGLAHSGRTNSEGCHNNRKTGGYHCHNSGYSSPGSSSGSSYPAPAPVPRAPSSCSNFNDCMELGKAWMYGDVRASYTFFQTAYSLDAGDLEAFTYRNIMKPYVGQTDGDCANYDLCMSSGYSATSNQNHESALIYFQRALYLRPDDEYALGAIRNVSRYIMEAKEAETQGGTT